MRSFATGLIVATVAGLALVARRTTRLLRERVLVPADNPQTFLQHGRQPATHTVVVCAGDSLTHGLISANYVELLQQQFGSDGYEFVNAGINSQLAYNLLQRIDEIIACQPDIVTILIGTNDVNATLNHATTERYRRQQQLPETPTLAWYQHNLAAMIDRLQASTTAQIAVLSLPMLGENLTSEMNGRVRAYNAVVQTVAAQKQITYLPLHEALTAVLPPNHTAPPYEGKLGVPLSAALKRYVLRKKWHEISAEHGLRLLTDHIHLNKQGAQIIASLISGLLESTRPAAS